MARFVAPKINDNHEGWGPPADLPPSKFRDIPYAAFSKSDKLGKAADWTASARAGKAHDRYSVDGDEEGMFQTVEGRASRFSAAAQGRSVPLAARTMTNFRDFRGRNQDEKDRGRKGDRKDHTFRRRFDDRRRELRKASIEIQPDWVLKEELTFNELSKLSFSATNEPEDLAFCGVLQFYEKANDRVSVKMEKQLDRFEDKTFHYVTTTDDPVIRELASQGQGNIYITSSILSLLMAAPRSVYSWDVIVQRVGDKLFFDKRAGSVIDMLTVNESAHDPPKDEKNLSREEQVNSLQSLTIEATLVNQNFSQAVLSSNQHYKLERPNPFAEPDEHVASVGYRYRKWKLRGYEVVVRTELDAVLKAPKEDDVPSFLVLKALNEVPDLTTKPGSGNDWRNKLDSQRGAVFATELKNNATKITRWTISSLLSGADQLKLGFVSRVSPRDISSHVILGVQSYKPREFAAQIGLNLNNSWGIFLQLVQLCYKHIEEDGKAVIMKDPNKPIIRLYGVPEDAFEDEKEKEEEEDEEEGEIIVETE
eukprot:jgi/Galph1/5004/GphlegSOOS_G3680.1